MFDLFDFQPVDYDPFNPPLPPPRPLALPEMPKRQDFRQGDIAGILGGRLEVQEYMRSHPAYEEWQGQPMAPTGEEVPAPWEKPPEDPTSGAKNLWQAFRTRGWDPNLAGRTGQYWSRPVDRINALNGVEGVPSGPEYHGPPEFEEDRQPWTPPPNDLPPESPWMERLRRIFGPKGYGPGTGNTDTIYSRNDLGGV